MFVENVIVVMPEWKYKVGETDVIFQLSIYLLGNIVI